MFFSSPSQSSRSRASRRSSVASIHESYEDDPVCTIRVQRNYAPYAVKTKTAGIKDYHDTIFGGLANPLCKSIKKFNGREVEGCDRAAAFTSWAIKTSTNLYGAAREDGYAVKLPFHIDCKITTALPRWSRIDATTKEEREEVRRFEMRTAYHERGHGLACESIAQAMRRFIYSMPPTVLSKEVVAMNLAVSRVLTDFYLFMGRKADIAYDHATGHGFTQGAEAKDAIAAKPSVKARVKN